MQYRVPGEDKLRREYFGVGPQGEAAARLRDSEVKNEKAKGKRIEQTRKADVVYLDAIAQAYLTDRKMAGASARWLKEMEALLNEQVLPLLAHMPVDTIGYVDIMAVVNRLWGDKSLPTRQRYIGYLRAVFRFGVAHGLTNNQPLQKWKKTKEKKKHLILTVEDLRKILNQAPPHLAWALEVEWALGTRPGKTELFALRWVDIDFSNLMVYVPGTKTHQSARYLPLTPEFAARLQEVRKDAQSGYVVEYKGQRVGCLARSLKTAVQKAGIGYPVTMYDIRHLFASTLLADGADLAAVSKLLGHSQISTTQDHYYHLLQGEMRRALDKQRDIS